MRNAWTTLFVCGCYFFFTKCYIPTLTVRRVDQKVIDRKRQDTLEICRLFNEEIKHLESVNGTNSTFSMPTSNRVKREVKGDVDNPLLKEEDVRRVESIVDKIYDDMEQNGKPITYRRRNLNDEKIKDQKNISRRFNFAPAQLFGPLPEEGNETKVLNTEDIKIPWTKKWKHGIVPFFIDPNTYAETIIKTFEYIEKLTCIRLQRLREKPTDEQSLQSVEWLYISNPLGLRQCVHSNERKPNMGVQMVVFGYDCLSKGEISHEVMHVLGFSHEHTRADRDKHIDILWDNIKPGYKKYFEVRKDDQLLVFPYDYSSVLHYPARAFSKNGQITVKTQSEVKIGQREALSELDVEKIGMIYGPECVDRNKDYFLKTCPSAVKTNFNSVAVTDNEVEKYFENRIWPYGVINYKLRNLLEFTSEERDNINAVLKHIEKETCIEFRDVTESDESLDKDDDNKIEDNEDIPLHGKDEKNSSEVVHINVETETTDQFDDTTANPEQKLTEVAVQINDEKKKLFKLSISDGDSMSDSGFLRLRNNQSLHLHKKATHKIKKINLKKSKKTSSDTKPSRRHSENIMILERSSQPGCICPPPGRPNGKMVLNLHSDCFNSVNDLLHVFVHVLGLEHQHNMYDRDDYLHILWNEMTPEIKKEMEVKLPPAASVGFAYDYQSVMHYPWLQIKDGTTNIMYPVWNDGWAMGHWQGLSLTDVNKIDFIYKFECTKREREAGN